MKHKDWLKFHICILITIIVIVALIMTTIENVFSDSTQATIDVVDIGAGVAAMVSVFKWDSKGGKDED